MKQYWRITVSGGCPTFEGPEALGTYYGEYEGAENRRAEIEKHTGRIAYLALMIPQPQVVCPMCGGPSGLVHDGQEYIQALCQECTEIASQSPSYSHLDV